MDQVNLREVVMRLIKYLIEGFAVAVAAYFIPKRRMNFQEIATIAVTASAIFAVLDMYAPSIGAAARQGAGFGIGANQVGFALPMAK